MKQFRNPIVKNNSPKDVGTSDPYVIKYEGKYYHCYSRAGGVYVSVCDDISELEGAERFRVYSSTPGTVGSNWYAPELHMIGGRWYIYGAPIFNDSGSHCMMVLRATEDSPMCRYENIGMIEPIDNKYNLDGTVFEHGGAYYFVWSSGYKLHIARMASPTRLEGEIQTICAAELPFETLTGPVCEGPQVLKRNGKIHIVYSANDSKDDSYCLGRITYSGGDILNISSWHKCSEAIFKSTDEIFGPGHCSFVEGDGKGDVYVIYHANLESGTGWHGRHIFSQKIDWDSDDNPILGSPHF